MMFSKVSKYRPEIDGLRALAVLSVLFFHFEFKLFSGGFVGVDIFFVISGYLITKIIYDEIIKTNKFDFGNFYIRRIKRLFPSLFFILVVIFIIGFYLFPPQHLERLGGSIFHALLSISNFYFWTESGYFDTLSEFKPVLHTWSLSVEEQFYFIWPMLILFFIKKNIKLYLLLVFIGVGSLFLNLVYQESNSSIYFLTPFRMFEFVVGALVFLCDKIELKNKYLLEGVSFLGFLMILYAIFFFNKETIFPSYNALIPTVGTALILFVANRGIFLYKILSQKFVIFIGILSYSLYLVHWPVYVFYKYIKSDELVLIDKLSLMFISFIFAFFLHIFIEKPFRYGTYKRLFATNKFFISSCFAFVIFLSITLHSWMTNGWAWRYPENLIKQLSFKSDEFHKYVWEKHNELERQFNNNGKKKILVIGDSMAGNFVNVLKESNMLEELDLVTIPVRSGCKSTFILKEENYINFLSKKKDSCKAQHQAIMNDTRIAEVDSVVLASDWKD